MVDYKVLGQVNPPAVTLTDGYIVPALKQAIVSTLVVTNRSAVATTCRISVAPAGVADNLKQYIVYDATMLGNESKFFTIGITLATTDVIRVFATLATLSFNIFGTEIS